MTVASRHAGSQECSWSIRHRPPSLARSARHRFRPRLHARRERRSWQSWLISQRSNWQSCSPRSRERLLREQLTKLLTRPSRWARMEGCYVGSPPSLFCCFRRSINSMRSDSAMRYPRLPMRNTRNSPRSTQFLTVLSLTCSCCATCCTVNILSCIGLTPSIIPLLALLVNMPSLHFFLRLTAFIYIYCIIFLLLHHVIIYITPAQHVQIQLGNIQTRMLK